MIGGIVAALFRQAVTEALPLAAGFGQVGKKAITSSRKFAAMTEGETGGSPTSFPVGTRVSVLRNILSM